MLQRIQTIFLSFLIIAMIIFLFAPIGNKITNLPEQTCTLYAWKLQTAQASHTTISHIPYALLGGLSTIIIMLTLYTIFCFNNRKLQLKIGTLNSLLITILMITTVWFTAKKQEPILASITSHYNLGFFMPLLAALANIAANYFIRKDETLVQSTNRIR